MRLPEETIASKRKSSNNCRFVTREEEPLFFRFKPEEDQGNRNYLLEVFHVRNGAMVMKIKVCIGTMELRDPQLPLPPPSGGKVTANRTGVMFWINPRIVLNSPEPLPERINIAVLEVPEYTSKLYPKDLLMDWYLSAAGTLAEHLGDQFGMDAMLLVRPDPVGPNGRSVQPEEKRRAA